MPSKMAFYQKGTSINLAKAKIISDFRDLNEKFKITVYDSTVFQTSNLNLDFLCTLDIISLLCKIDLAWVLICLQWWM